MIVWQAEDEQTGAKLCLEFFYEKQIFRLSVTLGEANEVKYFPALYEVKEEIASEDLERAKVFAVEITDELLKVKEKKKR